MTKIEKIKLLHLLLYPWGYINFPLATQIDAKACAEIIGEDLPVDLEGRNTSILAELSRIRSYRPLTDRLMSELLTSYRELAEEDGQQLARDTIGLWRADPAAYRHWVEEILLHLACLVPGALRGCHGELIQAGVFRSGMLYLDADAEARDCLLKLWVTPPHLWEALGPLIWIGDEVVQQTFQRWRRSPPAWRPDFAQDIETYGLTHDAGWELTPAGKRRDLYHQQCYPLVPNCVTSEGGIAGPVNVAVPFREECPWCHRHLTILLDLNLGAPQLPLFDTEPPDTRLAFLAPGWSHLRIATCTRCTLFTPVFTEVDPEGGSRWSELNLRPDYIGTDDHGWDFPERRLVLGPHRRGPFEARVSAGPGPVSQIGGFPIWEQSADYPSCPKCSRAMCFAGQLCTWEALGEPAPGTTYAFFCQGCGMAATSYQQD